MKAPEPKKTYDPAPKGSHVARLYQIINLGTTEFEYMGEMKRSTKLRLTFELSNEMKVFKEGEEAKPLSVSREFGFSMSPRSKLRPFIESMLGTALHDKEAYNFDFDDLLGRACLLTVDHASKGEKTYAYIISAAPLPKGMKAPGLYNEPVSLDVNSITEEQMDTLPDFLKEKMWHSEEWALRQRATINVAKAKEVLAQHSEGSLAKANRPSFVQEEPEESEDEFAKDIPF